MTGYPLVNFTTILYQPYKIAVSAKEQLASVYNYCSYVISSNINKMDENPVLYNGMFLGLLAGGILSVPNSAAIVCAMGISYGAATLANYIVNSSGPEYQRYAQVIASAGEVVLSVACYGIISATVLGIFAASPLAVVPATILAIPAAVIAAGVYTQVKRFEYAVEDATIGKKELEKNLDRKFISNSEDLYLSVLSTTIRATLNPILSNVLAFPKEVATLLAMFSTSSFMSYMDSGENPFKLNHTFSNMFKGALKFMESKSHMILRGVLNSKSILEGAILAGGVALAHLPINNLVTSALNNFNYNQPSKIDFSQNAIENVQATNNKQSRSLYAVQDLTTNTKAP